MENSRGSRRWRGWPIGSLSAAVGAAILAAGIGGWWLANATLIASNQSDVLAGPSTAPKPVSAVAMPDVRGLRRGNRATSSRGFRHPGGIGMPEEAMPIALVGTGGLACAAIVFAAIGVHRRRRSTRPGSVGVTSSWAGR